jgi:UDP-N-acetylglucosamine 1-carboxyvinyltransferase
MKDNAIKSVCISPSRLEGRVKVSGAKNSVLRLMAATILTKSPINLSNYPSSLLDAEVHLEMLKTIGKTCTVNGHDELAVTESITLSTMLKWDGRSIRNTLLILGALLSRYGKGAVPLPGGCQIGGSVSSERAYDLHELVFKTLGAQVWTENGYLHAESNGERLVGADIHLPIRSTGATENGILCGVLAQGVTNIWNPHIRPEILDLVDMLRSMGALINVYGQERIEVIGVDELRGTNHKVIPDNVEALTWLVGASITDGEVEIVDFPAQDLEVPLIHLRESGAKIYQANNSIIVKGGSCYPLEVSTGPYPGINSDMQPILAVYAAKAKGRSKFVDLRFPGRYAYSKELNKLGLDSRIDGNMLVIDGNGGKNLLGSEVVALDLRAGISLSLAALIAENETKISDAWQIIRGYDRFQQKMKDLGVRMTCE